MSKVVWKDKVDKQLEKIPSYIRDKFHYWVDLVERYGVGDVRKIKGFRDESLKGSLVGLRSVRLNRSYRVLYKQIDEMLEIELIEVLGVSNHEYKK